MSTELEILEQAKEQLSMGKHEESLRLLSFAFEQAPDNKDCYVLASICLKQMQADSEAEKFDRALSSWDDWRPFFELGYHFVGAGHDRLAIPMLKRAFSLSPGNSEIGLELSIALCGRFQPQAARELLLSCDLSANFWLAYQLYWSSLLCGIDDGAEQFIRESRRSYLAQAATDEIKGALYALDKLDELRLRLAHLKNPQSLIRDWHYLQYGSAILDYFDDQDGQEGLKIAGGRWVYVGLSYLQMSITLNKARLYLQELGKMPKHVLALADRDSQIIARAFANLFSLPLSIVEPANAAREESLLVAANNWNLASCPLEKVLKGQTVFAFNHNWLAHGPQTPDLLGIMSQYCSFPWSAERIVIDPETKESKRAEEDLRPVEDIALEFSSERDVLSPEFAALLDFYKGQSDYLKGGRLGGSKRWRFITDSPVPGSYFA